MTLYTPLLRRWFVTVLWVLLAIGWMAAPVSGQQLLGGYVTKLPNIRNFVGVGIGVLPDYMGSDDYSVGVGPSAFVSIDDTYRYVSLFATELSVNVLDDRDWALGPTLNYRLSRADVKDQIIRRMRDIDGTIEAGFSISRSWINDPDPRHHLSTSLDFSHDVGSVHDGYLVVGSVNYFRPVLLPLTLMVGADLTYGSGRYMQTYFGVDSDNASRSGLRQFDAGSGLRDFRLKFSAILSLSPEWHLGASVFYARLLGSAADSPVVKDRGTPDQIYGLVGVAYAW